MELELNLHHMMELAGRFGVVINSIVNEPVYTCVGITDVIARASLSTKKVAPEVELGSPLDPTSVTKTDDSLPMRGLTHTAKVSDSRMTSDCRLPKLQKVLVALPEKPLPNNEINDPPEINPMDGEIPQIVPKF